MVLQLIQLAGSILILAAFLAAQVGRVTTGSLSYLVLNMAGSAVLAVLAAIGRDYGFLLLEGVWAVVSTVGVVGALRRNGVRAAPD